MSFLNIPNIISLLRVPLALAVIVTLSHPLSFFFLGVAIFTDWLDGFAARMLKQKSASGALIDPLSDKLFVVIVFLSALFVFKLPLFYIAIFFLRDVVTVLMTLYLWLKKLTHIVPIEASFIGKTVTVLQFVALVLLLAQEWDMLRIGMYVLLIGSIWCIVDYICLFMKVKQRN